jgi:SulP family sulfate permease
MMKLSRYLPILASLKGYDRGLLARDLIAALVVTIMLIPQSLAYALLAGVPPQVGLYASMLPLLAYALFGTSRTLSVGPVAIASLMTAVALKDVAEQGTSDYLTAAIVLALLSGILLMAMGALRLGVLANLLSHSVVSGFITASAVIIALSQMKHILGVSAHGDTLLELVPSLLEALPQTGMLTLGIGVAVILFLLFARRQLARLLVRLGVSAHVAGLLAKAAPVLSVIATILVVYLLRLDLQGVAVVGEVPQGLPVPGLPVVSLALVGQLLVPALVISIIGYVESISVGKTLAARHRQRIDSDQELIGLGAANVASAVSGGFPVTGGFSRSVVNYDAGAATQLAGVMTAIGIALTAMYLTP